MNKFRRQINIIKNNDLETLENLLHDDFMFIRESGLVTRDEFVEHIKMLRTESGGLKFLDFKCCYEDENTLVWQDIFLLLHIPLSIYLELPTTSATNITAIFRSISVFIRTPRLSFHSELNR